MKASEATNITAVTAYMLLAMVMVEPKQGGIQNTNSSHEW